MEEKKERQEKELKVEELDKVVGGMPLIAAGIYAMIAITPGWGIRSPLFVQAVEAETLLNNTIG